MVDSRCHQDSVLKAKDVQRIRSLYSSKKRNQRELAEMFRVSRGHIGLIIQGKRWHHMVP